MPGTRKSSSVESLLEELDEEQRSIWEHRFLGDEAFVRAYRYAKSKGNGPKGCLVYADAHAEHHENSDTPVVQKTDA